MHYKLFVDRVFAFHFIMNFLLLYLTARMCSYKAGYKRLAGSAAAGALFFLAILVIPLGYPARLIKPVLMIAAYAVMLQLAFRFRGIYGLLRACLYFTASSCALGGLLSALNGLRELYLSEPVNRTAAMSGVILPAAAASLGCVYLLKWEKKHRQNPVFVVKLKEGEKEMQVQALADSGNSLFDPVSGRPVCIVEKEIFQQLGLMNKPEKFRIIPYHSIGKKHGLLQAAAIDEMYLQKDGQEQSRKQVLVAVSAQRLSEGGGYRMLLHPALLEEKKGENNDIESSDAGQDAV